MPYQRIDNSEDWSPDADLSLADWLRQTWTLPTDIFSFLPVLQRRNDAQTFDECQQSLDGFMTLPIASSMPQKLKDELREVGFVIQE
ncbi:MAG: hypothetical protein QM589_12650 [Thermomicrobiales bacterium]